jgi:hypothetical protein
MALTLHQKMTQRDFDYGQELPHATVTFGTVRRLVKALHEVIEEQDAKIAELSKRLEKHEVSYIAHTSMEKPR